jgi:hypothetical protein
VIVNLCLMTKANFITGQLRDSAAYLNDAGFRETAKLVLAAAEEIEQLRSLLEQCMPELRAGQREANENQVIGPSKRRRLGPSF